MDNFLYWFVLRKKRRSNMENKTNSNLGVAIVYALIASVIGGGIWGAIIIIAEYQLGIIALAIGAITGYAVYLAAKENVTQAHKIIAAIASLIGIIIGKYTGFAYLLNDGFEYFLNSFTRNVFFQNFSEFFSMYDIIFIILAVITAWEIPSKISKKKAVEANEAD